VLRISAGQLHPVTAPPIENGAVLIDGYRIAAVGPDARVPGPATAQRLAFPDAVLVPGLVNCHTHLELTHLRGENRETRFPDWVQRVRELKDSTSEERFAQSAEQGIRDSWAGGVTCVAETGSTGAVIAALARLGGRGVVYHEVFGPDPATCTDAMVGLEAAIVLLNRFVSDRVRLGVSPHAPYTVSAALYRAVGELARLERLPLAVHLAESAAEAALVRHGAGPFAERLRGRGIAVAPRAVSPVRYLADLGVLGPPPGDAGPRTLCIHCVQVDSADVALLHEVGAAVAVCPRSNLAHGHGRVPLAAFRRAGLCVGLGTDSVVSVPDLDLWAEAAAVGLSGGAALRALTWEGAQTLGWESAIGSLEVGKAADLAVFRSIPPAGEALLTVVAGQIVHRRGAAAPPAG